MNTAKTDIWNTCLDLVIESFNAKSLAIAAVITNADNKILAIGSNQLRDNRNSHNKLFLSTIAHAEMNAIHNLGITGMDGKDFTLYTTVEPCPMCMGAIAMSRIRKVVTASKDPYAGSTKWAEANEYIKGKNIHISFEEGYYDKLFFALHYLSIKRKLQDRPNHKIYEVFRTHYEKEMFEIDTLLKESDINKIVLSRKWVEENISNPK